MNKQEAKKRLAYIRKELRAERISYGELAELESLRQYIDPSDVELLEAAGVPEKPTTPPSLATAKRRINAHAKRAYESRTDNAGRSHVRGLAFVAYKVAKEGNAWEDTREWAELVELSRFPRGGDTYKGFEVRNRGAGPYVYRVDDGAPQPERTELRAIRLAPLGVPRWVRCYDNGGETADRYTVVFTSVGKCDGVKGPAREFPYLGMSAEPFHPQGIGQHGATNHGPCDTINHAGSGKRAWGNWPPALGRKCHLGRRIRFEDLPHECQRCVWQDYASYWGIPIPTEYRQRRKGA